MANIPLGFVDRPILLGPLLQMGPRTGTPSSQRRHSSQITSLLAKDIDLYSAALDDFETVALPRKKQCPRNIHQPVVDLLALGHLAQFALA